MQLVRCKNGHRYDASLTSECPECALFGPGFWAGEITFDNVVDLRNDTSQVVNRELRSVGTRFQYRAKNVLMGDQLICRNGHTHVSGSSQICPKCTDVWKPRWMRLSGLDYDPSDLQIASWAVQLCRKLMDLKASGIVHGDIITENIEVSDSGIIRFLDDINGLRNSGLKREFFIRRNFCLAPEVAATYTYEADVYSLGLVLYWLLNGRRNPFLPVAPTEADIKNAWNNLVQGKPLPELKNDNASDVALSRGLRAVVMTMCDARPDKRPDISEAERQLRFILDMGLRHYSEPKPIPSPSVTCSAPTPVTIDIGGCASMVEEKKEETRLPVRQNKITLETCRNGHRYDPSLTSECPECAMFGGVLSGIAPIEYSSKEYDDRVYASEPEPEETVPLMSARPSTGRQNPWPAPQCSAPEPRWDACPAPAPDQELYTTMACAAPSRPAPMGGKKRGLFSMFRKDKKETYESPRYTEAETAPRPAAAPPRPAPVVAAPVTKPAEEAPRLDRVQFSAVAPKEAEKDAYSIIQIFMYEQMFRRVVEEALEMAESPAQEKRSGFHMVQDNTRVKIVLTCPDMEIDDNVQEQTWSGGYLQFDFAVCPPSDYRKKQILLTAAVYFNDIPATRLMLTIKPQMSQEERIEIARKDIITAFVSYASQDRARVATVIQGMRRARPDMDIFFDINSLKSGEDWERTLYREIDKRDILFLCWSRSAAKSPWVDREWRYAMSQKGIEAIEPIPLEQPDVCPPPMELQSKHFNDSLLYVIR